MLGGEQGVVTLQKPRAVAGGLSQPAADQPVERRITAADFWAMVDPDSEPKQRSAKR